nr:hypothetical protein [Paramuribaculum intestinale]
MFGSFHCFVGGSLITVGGFSLLPGYQLAQSLGLNYGVDTVGCNMVDDISVVLRAHDEGRSRDKR